MRTIRPSRGWQCVLNKMCTAVAFVAASTLMAPAVHAAPLISMTDLDPGSGNALVLSNGFSVALEWTQTEFLDNASLDIAVAANSAVPGDWWLTTALGPGTTAAHVVGSGQYLAPVAPPSVNFNNALFTTVFSGLSLAPDTYYLVLAGPSESVFWFGEPAADVAVNLAPGFTLGSYHFTQGALFPPSASFVANASEVYAFELSGDVVPAPVPEPGMVMMLVFGASAVAIARRRRRSE